MPGRASGKDARAAGTDGSTAELPAGLRYANDDDPGINRRRSGKGFAYRGPDGERLTDERMLERIRSLAIPPAWTDVWICPSSRGHIQATGRDARGRKQYRYHPLWRQVRDESKYERTIAFGEGLPRLRRQVERDLARRGLDRTKVVAAVVRLLDTTLLRVGNEAYARQNRTYGLTTLRDQHGRIRGSHVRFSFRGKSGKRHEVSLRDPRLARIVRRCQELPGQRLFQYLDEEGQPQPIDSDDVNEYLRAALGDDFSARDFRTWAGTVLAFRCLRAADAPAAAREEAVAAVAAQGRRSSPAVTSAISEVARWLGNTPAVCRSAYIHPAVIGAFENGGFSPSRRRPANGDVETRVLKPPVRRGLGADEREVLHLLRRLQRQQRRQAAAA
jgi:DNA topoisomerase I